MMMLMMIMMMMISSTSAKGDEAFAKRKAGMHKNELNEQLKVRDIASSVHLFCTVLYRSTLTPGGTSGARRRRS